MSVSCEKIGDILVVSLIGQVNSANASEVESTLLGRLDDGETRCLLDFEQLNYISSAGLRVILLLAKRLRQHGGRLVLCTLQPNVREVFDISGFLSILTVANDRESGLAQLSA